MTSNVEELKDLALAIARAMSCKVVQVTIDVNTSYNTATVKVAEIHKKIKEGDEVTVSETRTIK